MRIIYDKFFNRGHTQTYADKIQEIYDFYLGNPFDSAQNRSVEPKAFLCPSAFVCVRRANEVSGRLIGHNGKNSTSKVFQTTNFKNKQDFMSNEKITKIVVFYPF